VTAVILVNDDFLQRKNFLPDTYVSNLYVDISNEKINSIAVFFRENDLRSENIWHP